MTTEDFNRISEFVTNEYGIKMPASKKVMIQSRLQKRLRTLNMDSYTSYCDFVFSQQGRESELINMIDVITTNKTDFFREAAHFDFLMTVALPEFTRYEQPGVELNVWSAGCSSGEEPYTLAMVLSEYSRTNPGLDFNILATDISVRILKKGMEAVYPSKRVAHIPLTLKKRYLLKSKDPANRTVKMAPHIRSKVRFQRLNFMNDSYEVPGNLDIIFCRNVLIYFDKKMQEQVIRKLCAKLKTGGYLFLGHSESIINMDLPLLQIKPTTYKRL